MKTKKSPAKAPPRELPAAFYSIDALLRTMRVIAQHEDRLCTLLHSIKHARAVEPDALEDLQTLLAELPSREYTDDLAAVHNALTKPAPKPKASPAKKSARKSAKKTPQRRSAKA